MRARYEPGARPHRDSLSGAESGKEDACATRSLPASRRPPSAEGVRGAACSGVRKAPSAVTERCLSRCLMGTTPVASASLVVSSSHLMPPLNINRDSKETRSVP